MYKNLWHRSIITVLQNRRLIIRAGLTLAYYGMVFYILHVLFYHQVSAEYRDMINIIVGAIIVSLGKVTDFWFRKDDEDLEEEKKEPQEDPPSPVKS
jgi:hypothetical protein